MKLWHYLPLYYHTARYLKRRQLFALLLQRLRQKVENPKRFSRRKAPPFPGFRSIPEAILPPIHPQVASQGSIVQGTFTFLNRTESLGWPPLWDVPGLPKLWIYNLHYFDWIWGLNPDQARHAVGDWISKHPLGRNRVGWEPYPLSIRLMNWAGYFLGQDRHPAENEFRQLLWQSMYMQMSWLQRHIETHLLANHLLENAAAMAFVGSRFEGAAARKWMNVGVELLRRELAEQLLPDGVHFERSPMYHCRVLYVLLLLASTHDPQLASLAGEPAVRMIEALACLTHPDGRIALINDSAFGIYPEPKDLREFGSMVLQGLVPKQPPSGAFALKDAGFYGWRGPQGHYILCDAGAIGPDYQPGHSHAGIFSFELSLGGKRIVVDSGVYGYEPGKERAEARSTRAHNTVEIAGKDQCEMWGSFRVGRRARVEVLHWTQSEMGFRLQAVHDGYKRLRAGLRHRRRFIWKREGRLEVTDSLEGIQGEPVVSRLHLSPDCGIDHVEGNQLYVSAGDLRVGITFDGMGRVFIEESNYYPEFGIKMPNKSVAFHPDPGVKEWNCDIGVIP